MSVINDIWHYHNAYMMVFGYILYTCRRREAVKPRVLKPQTGRLKSGRLNLEG